MVSNEAHSFRRTHLIINHNLWFVQHWRDFAMKEFSIALHSFADVQDFVSIAMVRPFRVLVGSEKHRVNGKNFIGMLTLDYSQPVLVHADCDEEALALFQQDAARFLI